MGFRVFKTSYKDRKGKTKEAAKWYVEFRDHLDTVRFTRHLETAFTAMWERSERREPSASFAVTLNAPCCAKAR